MCSTFHRKAYIITLLAARAQHFAAIPCCEHFRKPKWIIWMKTESQIERERERVR